MKTIEIAEKGDRLKITDDKTYQEVTIYTRDNDQLEELVLKLVPVLLKGDD